jgi:hypothetical protein
MEDEITFQLVLDPDLRRTMEDPLFTDFQMIIGEDKRVYPVNLTFFSMFSITMREYFKKVKNDGVMIEKVELPEIDHNEFRIVHHLITRGKTIIHKAKILGALRMATFFKINTLMNFLTDYVERNEEYIDKIDIFLFSFESKSTYLYALSTSRVAQMGEEPFLSEKLHRYFSEEAFKKLLSRIMSRRTPELESPRGRQAPRYHPMGPLPARDAAQSQGEKGWELLT